MTDLELLAWEKLLGRKPTPMDLEQIGTLDSVFGYAYGAIDASWSLTLHEAIILLDSEEAWSKAERPENVEENRWRMSVPLPVKLTLLFTMLHQGLHVTFNPALQAKWNALMDKPYINLPEMKLPEPYPDIRAMFFGPPSQLTP